MNNIHNKKILYVITKTNFGGAQKYVLQAASLMRAEGADVAVIHGENDLGVETVFTDSLVEKGIRHKKINGLTRDIGVFSELRTFFFLVREFKKERPYAVHLNSSKIGGLGTLAGRIAGVKNIVYTAHGLPYFEDIPRWKKIVREFATKITFSLAHKNIVISRHDQKAVSKWGSYNKTFLIPIGINCNELSDKDKQLARNELVDAEQKEVLIGTIAEFTKNKGIEYLIDALALLTEKTTNFKFIIWGDGELREILKKQADSKKVSPYIMWMGFDIKASKKAAGLDIFTLTSLKEGLPYVLLQAGCARLSVVASEVGGIPDVITHEKDGLLVAPKDIQGIANALEMLIGNPDKREKMGTHLHETVGKNFNEMQMFEDIKSLYLS